MVPSSHCLMLFELETIIGGSEFITLRADFSSTKSCWRTKENFRPSRSFQYGIMRGGGGGLLDIPSRIGRRFQAAPFQRPGSTSHYLAKALARYE